MSLCEVLDQYNKLIIYGTGDFARQIYPQLVEYGLKEKIVCFTQTDKGENDVIDGIPVLDIRTLNCDKAECGVLIAVSELYVDVIKQTLLQYGYLNIIPLSDYHTNYKRLAKEYSGLMSFQEYCEYIADWCMVNGIENANRNKVAKKLLHDRETLCEQKKNLNQIVMICGHLSARTVKIAGAIRRKKYDIVMLNYFEGSNPWCENEMTKLDIQSHRCHCIAEMLYYALQYNPLVYFIEPRWGNCLWAEIMLRNKQYFGKLVLDLYDVMNDGYVGIDEERLKTERYALEHADGIVWRWFSKDYLERKGFEFHGKSIQFLDYCNHDVMASLQNTGASSVLKLCAIAGYGDEYVEDRNYPVKYCDWARIGEILDKIGNREDCIFHFYTGSMSDDNIERCKWYERQYTNFRFFINTGHDELVQRLEDYDFGCELHTDRELADEEIPIGQYFSSILKNGTCNKFFDFLSAGLPVIATHPLRLCEYLSTYGVVVKMNVRNLDIDNLKRCKEYYREKVSDARKKLDIDSQIERLIQFFKDI